MIRYLPSGFYLAVEVDGLAYALPVDRDPDERQLVVRLAARTGLAFGLQF